MDSVGKCGWWRKSHASRSPEAEPAAAAPPMMRSAATLWAAVLCAAPSRFTCGAGQLHALAPRLRPQLPRFRRRRFRRVGEEIRREQPVT